MTISYFTTSPDILAESRRLITSLEHRHADLPFTTTLRAMYRELELSHASSEAAVAAWRAALARRWECEVAGRRFYKQTMRELIAHYGSPTAPQVQLLSRGEAEANSSPAELLLDLRRLQAALMMVEQTLPVAPARMEAAERVAIALEDAIAEAHQAERQRRIATLESRMACEACRRAHSELQRALGNEERGM